MLNGFYNRIAGITVKGLFIAFLVIGIIIGISGCKKTENPKNADNFSITGESEPLCGGWTAAENSQITPELSEIFNKAVKNCNEKGLKPEKLISTQVVAGINYRFLCSADTNGKRTEKTVTVYRDLNGNCTVTDIS